jgi:hypothetical protein
LLFVYSMRNPFIQLPPEVVLSFIYPYLRQETPFEIEEDLTRTENLCHEQDWIQFLNSCQMLMTLKKRTRYILLKSSVGVEKFLHYEIFRNYLFSLIVDKSLQFGIDFSSWYHDQLISNYSLYHREALFFPLLNGLHYVNLSSVYLDCKSTVAVGDIASISLRSLRNNDIAFFGNIFSLLLHHCYIDLRIIPTSVRYLSLITCTITSDVCYLSQSLQKLELLDYNGNSISKEGIESLGYLKSFHFSTGVFNPPYYEDNFEQLTNVNFSVFSNILEIEINCRSRPSNGLSLSCFSNVIRLILVSSDIPLITGLVQLQYLDVHMKQYLG